MTQYIIVSLASGLLFGTLDALINANPWAQKLYHVYKPIARRQINMLLGILIDLAYGFILAALFLMLFEALPGSSALPKGLSYGIIMWFFRVVMYGATQYVMFKIDLRLLAYMLISGLMEMVILGVFYAVFLPLTV